IEPRSQKEQPPPSVVFWLEHRMRRVARYLRNMRIIDMARKGMWVCDHEHTRWKQGYNGGGRRNAASDIFGTSPLHVFGLLLDPLILVPAELMLGVHVHRSMEPLHFKPTFLVIDCAKFGIVVKSLDHESSKPYNIEFLHINRLNRVSASMIGDGVEDRGGGHEYSYGGKYLMDLVVEGCAMEENRGGDGDGVGWRRMMAVLTGTTMDENMEDVDKRVQWLQYENMLELEMNNRHKSHP
ncbi:hypothetical protein Tco_0397513, partial [Tanacetum coccineum]